MFKRKFKDEFDFSGNSFLIENENDYKDFDRSIFVVYDKSEMIDYLNLEKKGTNVLVCLFNKQLYSSLSFLQEINNLILLDESKTKPEIIKDLKAHFKKTPEADTTAAKSLFSGSAIFQTQFNNLYNALFFLL
ncbi:hypothetical protein [Flavobacterium saccharophilum]|uniref:Uncharacterized protein n=1 Tax=Flavobacterium saccharophilum TaxID=29534 RepID=A0A1M7I6W4_9FLAO|nr:hypothetical protein [Flavobacterium saccharophilum]SHM36369.1 hypothetical protein SAMN05444366_3035 [Flavobacterium saccharophilum]